MRQCIAMVRQLILVLAMPGLVHGQPMNSKPAPAIQEKDVRAEIGFLASDALRGRGSATPDELVAAVYIASRLQEFGIEPAGDLKAQGLDRYIQRVPVETPEFASPPVLSVGAERWTHGNEIAVIRVGGPEVAGPLQSLKQDRPEKIIEGAFALISVDAKKPLRAQLYGPIQQGAAGVLVAFSDATVQLYEGMKRRTPGIPGVITGRRAAIVLLGPEATTEIEKVSEGAEVRLHGSCETTSRETRNVIGVLHGSAPDADQHVILLGAHMDHLGMNPALKGDQIYNGADDDASGTVAVLELARVLGGSPKLKRTIYFVLFGSEEKGGWGAEYFLEHPPVALTDIVADIEFEMIGRADPAVATDTLWLTGWERTNLGPELAKHGARLVGDPHPEQQFFQRSDNYPFALKGVVAQTISSYGLHKQYHTVEDEPRLIDYAHVTGAIQSLVKPMRWLADSDFVPQWAKGKKP